MPALIPWTTVEIGDVAIFSPSLPYLVVYTWYVDDEPVSHAKDEAPGRSVDNIHIEHARQANKPGTKAKPTSKAKSKPARTIGVAKSKKRTSVKKTVSS